MKFVLVPVLAVALSIALVARAADPLPSSPLDPRGKIHVPIGIPDSLDSLKTFVEPEGSFSPGFGTYGIYFWLWDAQQKKLFAPTMEGASLDYGLAEGGLLIPWSAWSAGSVRVRTEVCAVERTNNSNALCVVATRLHLTNQSPSAATVSVYVALRPLGPAGGNVERIGFSAVNDTLAVNGFPAIAAQERAQAVGALTNDAIGDWALRGELPPEKYPAHPGGRCSGALRYDLTLAPGQTRTFGFTCPVLPNRWAVRHQWDTTNTGARIDLNKPGTTNAGVFQPYPSLGFYRMAKPAALFAEATNFWRQFIGRVSLRLPDRRWTKGFAAMPSHLALCMNEGAPDAAVANYSVFNRDGIYMANVFDKCGRPELASKALDYFLAHPFNGCVQPEAENPGQILWALGEHWLLTRDRRWLERVFPSAQKLAALIRYHRTTPGPHFVSATSLEFGDALAAPQRMELKPDTCDGHHPEYTQAWDIAGLRAAATLASALDKTGDAASTKKLAEELFAKYDAQFGGDLADGYGGLSVLWPCRVYAIDQGKAFEQFKNMSVQQAEGRRYLPLARAHQGLLAGSRAAAAQTLASQLEQPQGSNWFAFDEGKDSGIGGWNNVLTTWSKASVAMPHGGAIAETVLLIRDALVFESGDKLVLFGGVPADWFKHPAGMRLENFPTHFGSYSASWTPTKSGASLTLSGPASPAGGFVLRLPANITAKITANGSVVPGVNGDFLLPNKTTGAVVEWGQ